MTPEQEAALASAQAKVDALNAAAAKRDLALQAATEKSVMEEQAAYRNPLNVAKQGLIKGAAGLGDVVVGAAYPFNQKNELSVPEDWKRLYEYATTKGAPVPQKYQPITELAKEAGYITPENQPNTPALKALDFISQLGASGGVNPVTVGRSLLTKTLPQAGMDIAKQFGRTGVQGAVGSTALQGAQYAGIENPFALAAITGAPMGAVGAVSSMRGTPSSITNEAMKGVSPEQLKLADALLKQSYANGAPLTGAEAIAQVAGQNPLTNVQRVVEASQKGGAITSPFMTARPDQNAQYMSNVLRGISPVEPQSAIPKAMQIASQNVVRGAEKSLTESVNPYYQAAKSDMREMQTAGKEFGLPQVFNQEVDALRQSSPAIRDALNHVVNDKYTGAFNMPQTSPQALIAAKKYLDAQYDKFSNTMAGSLDKAKAANAWGASRELDSFLASKSPQYAKGSNIYEGAQQNQIQPLKQSGVGIMAEQTGTPAELLMQQREQLMPANPVALFPKDIKRTAELLRRKDPELLPAWTAQNIQGIFNETAQNLQTGANQYGGAKVASTLAGNTQQKANLEALITASSGKEAWKGVNTFLDIMGAQGKRQPVGSQTSFNTQMQADLKTGGVASLPTMVTKPSAIKTLYEDFRYGKNTQELARLLTDPDSVNLMKQLAKTNPNTAKAQAIVDTLAGGVIASKPKEQE
ncbi:hypothetical protein UFOVP20_50 [uncultured Caudovirales phage]|uniref:Uncharacterized protein n=1 Tax=uncultured Caudovirales phage TaxID=2100421 RepID=A0A6J5KKU7_9CAUD|nr:hypothetical protein UFOVP20_50 [uncultured Caudovirales phage]